MKTRTLPMNSVLHGIDTGAVASKKRGNISLEDLDAMRRVEERILERGAAAFEKTAFSFDETKKSFVLATSIHEACWREAATAQVLQQHFQGALGVFEGTSAKLREMRDGVEATIVALGKDPSGVQLSFGGNRTTTVGNVARFASAVESYGHELADSAAYFKAVLAEIEAMAPTVAQQLAELEKAQADVDAHAKLMSKAHSAYELVVWRINKVLRAVYADKDVRRTLRRRTALHRKKETTQTETETAQTEAAPAASTKLSVTPAA
jgi:hypothetical protein